MSKSLDRALDVLAAAPATDASYEPSGTNDPTKCWRCLGPAGTGASGVCASCREVLLGDGPIEPARECDRWFHIAPIGPDNMGYFDYERSESFVTPNCRCDITIEHFAFSALIADETVVLLSIERAGWALTLLGSALPRWRRSRDDRRRCERIEFDMPTDPDALGRATEGFRLLGVNVPVATFEPECEGFQMARYTDEDDRRVPVPAEVLASRARP